jgi:hypothetical protein
MKVKNVSNQSCREKLIAHLKFGTHLICTILNSYVQKSQLSPDHTQNLNFPCLPIILAFFLVISTDNQDYTVFSSLLQNFKIDAVFIP